MQNFLVRRATQMASPRNFAFAAFAAVLVVLLTQIFSATALFVDFRYIWMAGRLWGEGISPYELVFTTRAASDFPEWTYPLLVWVYPPCWYPFALAFAQAPVDVAHRTASILALLSTIVGIWVVWRSSQTVARRPDWALLAIMAFILSASVATVTIREGAAGFVAQLGLAFIIAALLRPNQFMMTIGIALSVFKPQIGLPMCVALLLIGGNIRPLILAAICDLLLSAPAFLLHPPVEMARAIIDLSSKYTGAEINLPNAMTGVGYFLANAGLYDLSTGSSTLAAMAASSATALWVRYTDDNEASIRRKIAFAIPCFIVGIVSMHPGDYIAVLFVIPLVLNFDRVSIAICSLCYLMIWRAENVMTFLLHQPVEMSVGLISLGSTGLMLIAVVQVVAKRRDNQISQPPNHAP